MQLSALPAIALLAYPAAASDTHNVSDVVSLTSALATAANNDLILLEPGEYRFENSNAFRITQPIRIAARTPGSVTITSNSSTEAVVEGLAEGDLVAIDGIHFSKAYWFSLPPFGPGLDVRSNAGTVLLHDCEFEGANDPPSGLVGVAGLKVDGGTLLASQCAFNGSAGALFMSPTDVSGPGIHAIDAKLQLDDCLLVGRDGYSSFPGSPFEADRGSAGLYTEGGSLIASRSTFTAGDGGDGTETTTTMECVPAGAGGNAIDCVGPVSTGMEFYDCAFEPGVGGIESNACGGGIAELGVEFAGEGFEPDLTELYDFAVGLNAPGTVAGGWTVAVQLIGTDFSSPKWLAISRATTAPLALGFDGFPIMLAEPLRFVTLPANGASVVTVPTLPGPSTHIGLVLQGIELPPNLIRYSVPRASSASIDATQLVQIPNR